MDTKSLRVFLSLAETLNFTRSGERLHMSLSAVSRCLQKMEQELGRRLFERDNRSVRLTPGGEQFKQYAQGSIDNWQKFNREFANEGQDLQGEVSVYSSVTASYGVLSTILDPLRERHPGIDIKLHTGDQADAIERIQSGLEDIAVASHPGQLPTKLEFQALLRSPLLLIVPDIPCATAEALSGIDQVDETLDWSAIPVIVAERGLSRQHLQQWFRQRGIKPNIYAQVAGHEAIVAMVGLGLGVGIVPELVINHSALRAKVRSLDMVPTLEDFSVGLVSLGQRLENPLVRAFWNVAQASY
jgi:LysR family positive regulator for ilvC